jgi:hypothetical protein
MNTYCTEVRKLEAHFEFMEFHHVSRDNSIAADILSKLGSKCALVLAGVFVQDLRKLSIGLLSDPETSYSDMPPPGMMTVDFGTPSHEFIVNICTYLIF